VRRRKTPTRLRNTAGFYNFDALLLSVLLFAVGIIIVNVGSHWGLKWLAWIGMAVLLVAILLYLYLAFLRR
jgi:Na+/proline symporter